MLPSHKEVHLLLRDTIQMLEDELSPQRIELQAVTKKHDELMLHDFPGRIVTNELKLTRRRKDQLEVSIKRQEEQVERIKGQLNKVQNDSGRTSYKDRLAHRADQKEERRSDRTKVKTRRSTASESAKDEAHGEPTAWTPKWAFDQD